MKSSLWVLNTPNECAALNTSNSYLVVFYVWLIQVFFFFFSCFIKWRPTGRSQWKHHVPELPTPSHVWFEKRQDAEHKYASIPTIKNQQEPPHLRSNSNEISTQQSMKAAERRRQHTDMQQRQEQQATRVCSPAGTVTSCGEEILRVTCGGSERLWGQPVCRRASRSVNSHPHLPA